MTTIKAKSNERTGPHIISPILKVLGYPSNENTIQKNDVKSNLPLKKSLNKSPLNDKAILNKSWAFTYTRAAIRQRLVRQEITMFKKETLPHCLYTSLLQSTLRNQILTDTVNETKKQSEQVDGFYDTGSEEEEQAKIGF